MGSGGRGSEGYVVLLSLLCKHVVTYFAIFNIFTQTHHPSIPLPLFQIHKPNSFAPLTLQTTLNCPPHLLRPRTRNALLYIPVFKNTKCWHLSHAELLRDVFAGFDVIGVEFYLRGSVSVTLFVTWMVGIVYVRCVVCV